MIICVYLNPTIDKTLYMDQFIIGGTNRPRKVVVEGAGKGVNVAVVLRELHQDVKVMGFLYRSDGEVVKNKLEAHSVFYDFYELDGTTRTNTKLFDGATEVVTEINESGAPIDISLLQEEAGRIYRTAQEGDIVVLTGSLPPECPKSFYADMIRELNQKGVKCVLDADGEALALGVREKPYFIKPNIDEIGAIIGKRPEGMEEIKRACRQIIASGIGLVAVSMGSDGAVLCSANGACYASPIQVDVRSTVGAGDSMVAGIVASFGKPLTAQLAAGVAAATGSITLEGTELCTRELFDKYDREVNIKEL